MNTYDFRDKYRPRKFSDFVGNKGTIEILKNIIQKGQIPNGILFHGPPGSGKTSLALVLTNAIYCQNFSEDICGQCKHCLGFDGVYSGSSRLYTLHDCTGNDEKILNQISIRCFFAGDSLEMIHNIHIFDEFDRAKNSFRDRLRTSLEMQKNRLLIFCLIDINRIDEGFRQRVTVLRTSRPEIEDLVPWLQLKCDSEGITVKDDNALRQLAISADQLPRECLSLLQKISCFGKPLTTSLVKGIVQDNKGLRDGGRSYRILSS
jgi:DNA polymerase-3 subunit gamma/tau